LTPRQLVVCGSLERAMNRRNNRLGALRILEENLGLLSLPQ
jgi:hypothetical protein